MIHLVLSPWDTVGDRIFPRVSTVPGVHGHNILIEGVTQALRVDCNEEALALIKASPDYTVLLEDCWEGYVSDAVNICNGNAFKFVPPKVQQFITVVLENAGPDHADFLAQWKLIVRESCPVELQQFLDAEGNLPIWLLFQCQEGEPYHPYWEWLFSQEIRWTA